MDADEESKQQQDEEVEEEEIDGIDAEDAAVDGIDDPDADGDAHMSDEHAAAAADGEEGEQEEGEQKSTTGASGDGAAPRTLKRPVSAYFLYMSHVRPQLLAELDAAAQEESAATGKEVKSQSKSLGVVGKMAGERWKALPDEQKEEWITKSSALKAAYDAAILADPSLKSGPKSKDGAGGGGSAVGGSEFVIPLGRLKKILHLDASASKMSREALLLTEKATEQFLMWIAERSHLQAAQHKRKGLKAQDVEHTVRTNPRLEFLRAPLKRDFERFAATEAQASEHRKERFEELARKKKQKAEEAGTREIQDEEEEAAATTTAVDEETEEGEARQTTTPTKAAAPAAAKKALLKSRTIDSMFSKA